MVGLRTLRMVVETMVETMEVARMAEEMVAPVAMVAVPVVELQEAVRTPSR